MPCIARAGDGSDAHKKTGRDKDAGPVLILTRRRASLGELFASILHGFTSLGRVVLVLLLSPLVLLDGSELLGLGEVLPGAVPGGVLVDGLMLPDELDGVEELSGMVLEGDDGDDGDVFPDPIVPVVDGVGVLVVVVELLLVVGVAGGSFLLQAPSAARVAARATNLIELSMFTPTVGAMPSGCARCNYRGVGDNRNGVSA